MLVWETHDAMSGAEAYQSERGDDGVQKPQDQQALL